MKKITFCVIFSVFSITLFAQTSIEKPTAKASDVESIEAIITTLYKVISGDAGTERDWNRFNSLWHPNANLTMVTASKNKNTTQVNLNLEDFINISKIHNKQNGFYEIEIHRETEEFASIATVISSYTIKESPSSKEDLIRGVNMFHLYFDGTRWWIMNCIWQNESKGIKIPKKFLK